MEQTLAVLNRLEQDGILGRYAIAGAMGATFYTEPVLTFDLDVMVVLPQTTGGLLTLAPLLYEALRTRGYTEEGECVMMEGVPVQFLPAHNPLLEEALRDARDLQYQETPARVLRPEHLAAIAVQTGRDKDRLRVQLLRNQAKLDEAYLRQILGRHGLLERWRQWTTRILKLLAFLLPRNPAVNDWLRCHSLRKCESWCNSKQWRRPSGRRAVLASASGVTAHPKPNPDACRTRARTDKLRLAPLSSQHGPCRGAFFDLPYRWVRIEDALQPGR